MVRMACGNLIDTAILVSGDGDYVAAVKMVKESGKHLEWAYFNREWGKQLSQECDRFIKIERKMFEQ